MPGVFRFIALYFFLLLPQLLFAQKEGNIWYFGHFTGLDFNSGTPEVIHGGQINTMEGVATICNSRGKLLFYTEGKMVWNRLHQVMPNGSGLKGHVSSTQSAIIVPKIGDSSRYYIFTMDDYNSQNGLQYSIVNMNLDSGRGAVEVKNIPIITGVSEKLTAVRHCNQRDIWIITHTTLGNTYYAFLVDPSGVQTVPVVSHTGSSLLGRSVGYLKVSPDGRKLAAANWFETDDVSDFNNVTGTLSNSFSLLPNSPDSTYQVYGVEFSPSGKLLYVNTYFSARHPLPHYGNLTLQFDVTLSTPAAIRASKQLIDKKLWATGFQALQMASDGKMYMAKFDQKEIAVINHPNQYGTGCGFISDAIRFTAPNEYSWAGLPNFIQSYFFKRESFSYTVQCPGNKVKFQQADSNAGHSFHWDFGDPSSGTNNYSTLANPDHEYTSPGQHIAQLITYTPCGPDTLRQPVQTFDLALNLGADTLICNGANLVLQAGTNGTPYQFSWQDGSNGESYTVSSPGTYRVEIKNPAGCMLSDTINIDYNRKPGFSLGPDELICPGSSIYLKPELDPAWQLRWQDGSTARERNFTQAGIYTLQASNGCGTTQDEVLFYPGVCKVFVPSAFTPNGDGKNDLFKILGTEKIISLHLKVFNRWGETVFETRDKSKGWDGRYLGKHLPGVYIYMLEFKDNSSAQPQQMKGSFVLIR